MAEGADCDDSPGTHRTARGCGGDGGVSGIGGVVLADGGGDSVGWRNFGVLNLECSVVGFQFSVKRRRMWKVARGDDEEDVEGREARYRVGSAADEGEPLDGAFGLR